MAKFKRVSADEARSRMKDKRPEMARSGDENTVTKAAKAPTSWDPARRAARFIMTTQQVDRYGDIVVTAGADMTEFLRNPVGLLFHQSRQWPVARWEDIQVKTGRTPQMEGDFVVLPAGGPVKEVDQTAWMIENGGISACSIGFIPAWDDVELIWDDAEDYVTGFKFNAWELTECSVCAIPANAGALVKSAHNNLNLAMELVEDVLDNWVRSPSGLLLSRDDFEDRYKELAGERTFVVMDKDLVRSVPEIAPTTVITIPATTGEQAEKLKGLQVVFNPDHEENKDHPHVKAIDGGTGTVIDSWIVEEGEKKGVHALAVEFLCDNWKGMFRAIAADRLKIAPVLEQTAAEENVIDASKLALVNAKSFGEGGIVTAGTIKADQISISDAVITSAKIIPGSLDDGTIRSTKGALELTLTTNIGDLKKEMTEIEVQAEGLMSRIAKFFGMSKTADEAEQERVEPIVDTVLPAPAEEEVKAARERAAATLERLRQKQLIDAA